jgi:hypothetical protein
MAVVTGWARVDLAHAGSWALGLLKGQIGFSSGGPLALEDGDGALRCAPWSGGNEEASHRRSAVEVAPVEKGRVHRDLRLSHVGSCLVDNPSRIIDEGKLGQGETAGLIGGEVASRSDPRSEVVRARNRRGTGRVPQRSVIYIASQGHGGQSSRPRSAPIACEGLAGRAHVAVRSSPGSVARTRGLISRIDTTCHWMGRTTLPCRPRQMRACLSQRFATSGLDRPAGLARTIKDSAQALGSPARPINC